MFVFGFSMASLFDYELTWMVRSPRGRVKSFQTFGFTLFNYLDGNGDVKKDGLQCNGQKDQSKKIKDKAYLEFT